MKDVKYLDSPYPETFKKICESAFKDGYVPCTDQPTVNFGTSTFSDQHILLVEKEIKEEIIKKGF
jgi:hypothetical protein